MTNAIICNDLNSPLFVESGVDNSMIADVVSYQIALLKMMPAECKPAITQILTYEVINYWVPAGHSRFLTANLNFTPKLGDIITFGERRTCYTIIDILHLEVQHKNDINLWTIDLDRPLEEPIQANRTGFVTATVHLQRRMPVGGWMPFIMSRPEKNFKCVMYA